MLFNSGPFLLGLLPVALIGFFLLGAAGWRRPAIAWLSFISLVFYGVWNVDYVPLLLGSIAANYAVARVLARTQSRALLAAGVAGNLALLGYYKYAGFLVISVNEATGAGLPVPSILLPLAISFYTFQQIAFLVDAHDRIAAEPSFLNYCMFITFFPHLIAGPITHHREMIPQFDNPAIFRPQIRMMALGATVFIVGLFKKVIIADTIAAYAAPVFTASNLGDPVQAFQAWGGALAYTLQMYFDFSGYSDMAIGLGLLFGVRLPFNFDSPLKARNIIDYWARWHMTLTRFVTAYLYNPVAMRITRARMEAGKPRVKPKTITAGAFASLIAFPTILSMLVIGWWHGAGWQFALFGLLHGVFLTINHGFRALKARRGLPLESARAVFLIPSTLLTLACVVVGLVLFRSPDVASGMTMLANMAGAHGLGLHGSELFGRNMALWIAALLVIVWGFPNTQEWLRNYETGIGPLHPPTWIERRSGPIAALFTWRPSPQCAVVMGLLAFAALSRALSAAPTEFLYFKF